ncbi:hypothetical protein AN189_15540 [Loktanella sp. 3ANDIMAR09]|uniref:hypothetical protein n=1 Tax=Loktanella sp. 3ANDIMAR09 TaxID=1225657 RepID=UPI0006FE3CDF|nr:hypothetical protein [Loktanella sp. 3ANDIMAR09]KQI67363.1 hypothetical protein AN189_15540 [Loktanella sp. 3ANDIMAR09]
MLRIVLILLLIAGAAFAVGTVASAVRAMTSDPLTSESPMPKPFRLISFVLLFLLLLGVSTGWLGAA